MYKSALSCVIVLTLMLGAGCSGSDGTPPDVVEDPATTVADTSSEDGDTSEGVDDASSEDAGDEALFGFGDIVEGTFLLSGAAEEQYYSSNDELDFRTGGGCQGGAFGFSVNVQDAAGTTTFATFGAEGQHDLSGGAIGEFEAIDLSVTVFPGGDMSLEETYAGPVKMVISEHETGGATGDPNARRMTVTLLGSIPGDGGDLGVDVTYQWVMACV